MICICPNRDRYFSCSGNPIKIKYGLSYGKKGEIDLVEKGKINLYEEIQSHADSVDLHVVLKRFANGETDVLNQRAAAYGDFSNMPRSFAEVLNHINDAEETFNGLPAEIRANFGNSFARFYASMDDPTFMAECIKGVQKSVQIDKKEEKVDNLTDTTDKK